MGTVYSAVSVCITTIVRPGGAHVDDSSQLELKKSNIQKQITEKERDVAKMRADMAMYGERLRVGKLSISELHISKVEKKTRMRVVLKDFKLYQRLSKSVTTGINVIETMQLQLLHLDSSRQAVNDVKVMKMISDEGKKTTDAVNIDMIDDIHDQNDENVAHMDELAGLFNAENRNGLDTEEDNDAFMQFMSDNGDDDMPGIPEHPTYGKDRIPDENKSVGGSWEDDMDEVEVGTPPSRPTGKMTKLTTAAKRKVRALKDARDPAGKYQTIDT